MARLHQEPPVLYGAKITGGGSGGHHSSVLILFCPVSSAFMCTCCYPCQHLALSSPMLDAMHAT